MISEYLKRFLFFILFVMFIYSLSWTMCIDDKGKYNFADIFERETSPKHEYEELMHELLQNIEQITEKDLQIAMQSKMEQLEAIDGFSQWRQHEVETLTSQVQSAISRRQNPPDCSQAKKLVCNMNHQHCGLGCLIHHMAYCQLMAFATERVLIIGDEPWFYSNIIIKNLFSPVSSTCLDFEDPIKKSEVFPNDTTRTVEFILKLEDLGTQNNMPYDPPSLPTVLAQRISRMTRDPDAWWIAQFVGYLMRPNETVSTILVDAEKRIDFSSPIVGVHVRRGNKPGNENAVSHTIEEYMEEVELWFNKYEMSHPPTKRRVYLASDEPQVIQECKEKYPQYEIFDNPDNSKSDGKTYEEFKELSSLLGIIQDIHMLSLTNFVVCTHSSNVCSRVYELMLLKHGDASSMVHSLDISWWFLYRKFVRLEAVVEDLSTNLRKGDELSVDTTYTAAINTNSHSSVVQTYNIRTQEVQTYPIYKLKVIPRVYNFSIFN